ncbi:AzlD domain-containing protein [Aeromicrobium sp. CF3.5]|uniref:AzlD domain-containing protein n=1 Tax=Aeromicrobium sp. CF3.5 TaxID=3373078 RepID=UPI003EE5D9B2
MNGSVTGAAIWWTIAGVAVTTAAIKSFGPVLLGGRALPARFSGVIVLTAPAVLAALVATSVFADGPRLAVGASTVGVAAAAVIVWRRGSVLLAVVAAATVTAILRAVT